MAAITICNDFGAQKNKVWHCSYCFPIYFPWSDGGKANNRIAKFNTDLNIDHIVVPDKKVLQGGDVIRGSGSPSSCSPILIVRWLRQLQTSHLKLTPLSKERQCFCPWIYLVGGVDNLSQKVLWHLPQFKGPELDHKTLIRLKEGWESKDLILGASRVRDRLWWKMNVYVKERRSV